MERSGQTNGALRTLPVDGSGPEIVLEIAWVDPAKAIIDLDQWRRLAADRVPIGGDPFSAYCAEDGSLPLWPLAAVLNEAKLARRFVEDVLEVEYAGLRVPGPETTCADGDFLEALKAQEPEIRLGLPQFG